MTSAKRRRANRENETMVKEAGKGEAAKEAAPAIDYEGLLNTNGANLNAVMRASEAVWKGMAMISQEIMGFASTRLRHNLETSESLMHCQDAAEVFNRQFEYARTATQQYLDEANKLFAISTEVTRESWAPLEDRTRKAIDELRAR
jgi:hypothetical protein